jgi:hypothetical protein
VLISIIVVLVLAGLALWVVGEFTPPIDPMLARIIRVVIIVALVIYLLRAVGIISGHPIAW